MEKLIIGDTGGIVIDVAFDVRAREFYVIRKVDEGRVISRHRIGVRLSDDEKISQLVNIPTNVRAAILLVTWAQQKLTEF